MKLERTVERALRYVNKAEKKALDAQANPDTRRDYETMGYTLSYARYELTAALFTLALIKKEGTQIL